MGRFLARRLAWTLPILVAATMLVFVLVKLTPIDPAVAAAGGLNARVEDIEAMREELGLNRPIIVQYGDWLQSALRGDLGTSLLSSVRVSEEIGRALPITLSIVGGALLFAVIVGVVFGSLSAMKPGSWLDNAVSSVTTLFLSIPNFFLALLLVLFVGRWWGVLPTIGYVSPTESWAEWGRHLVLPVLALGARIAAESTRHVRAAMLDVLGDDYIRTARQKGISEFRLVTRHGLRNAALPLVTVIGLQATLLISGAVVIEVVFGIHGLGLTLVDAVFNGDYPIIQGILLVIVLLVVVINLVVDISYGYLNPRIRIGTGA